MDADEITQRIALRELSYQYARLVDRRDYPAVEHVFTADGVLDGPGYQFTGHAELAAGFAGIEAYDRTMHAVHNQLVEVDGDRGTGEVYCVANHIYEKDGVEWKLDMGVRYDDEYRREQGNWRIARRVFNLLWQQDLPLQG